jgi:hypothetical protein
MSNGGVYHTQKVAGRADTRHRARFETVFLRNWTDDKTKRFGSYRTICTIEK